MLIITPDVLEFSLDRFHLWKTDNDTIYGQYIGQPALETSKAG